MQCVIENPNEKQHYGNMNDKLERGIARDVARALRLRIPGIGSIQNG
jgi:hypothetical protein